MSMKTFILLLIVLAISCSKRNDHTTLTGTVNVCGVDYNYSIRCDDYEVVGLIKSKSATNELDVTIYTTDESMSIKAVFEPPLAVGILYFREPIKPGRHITSVLFRDCKL